MADLTITAANVLKSGSGAASYAQGTAGGTITAGMVCYLDAATSTYKAADTTTSAATANAVGIALHAALSGQPLKLMTAGRLAFGAILTSTKIYVLSTAGLIAPEDDLATSDWVTYLGYAASTSVLVVGITATGVQK